MGNGVMREKLLEKLMDFFSMLPDKSEIPQEGDPKGGKVEVVSIDAKPIDKDMKGIC